MSLPVPPVAPPIAPRRPHRIEQLGRVRVDDYAWMKDDAWQQVLRDPKVLRADVREHLDAENAYTKAMLAPTEALQAQMFAEMKGRIKEDDSSVPAPHGPWDYYVRYELGAQHPVRARRPKGSAEDEQVLLDEEAQSKGKAFFQVGAASHSPDHALFAWAADEQGSEYYQIKVRDLGTGDLLGDPIESAYGSLTFSPDSAWLFWIWRDENARPSKVFRRPARPEKDWGGEDVLVYEEADEGMFLGIGTASDDSHILIQVGNQETTEILVIPASDPTAVPAIAEPRQVGVKYHLDHWSDRWIVHTNADGAVDFKIAVSEAAVPAKPSWREWIAHRPGHYIAGIAAFAGHVVRAERVNALDRLVVTARDGSEHEVAFDEEAYALDLEPTYEYATTTARFVYQSPTTPRQTFDYDLASRERTLRKTQEVPSGHDPSRYVARRLYATAPDGAEVPITVLMLKDTPLTGAAPLLLYGYGSYGIAMEPSFSIRNLCLVDRGWIWATAHIRGGSDKGWGWFLDGRKEKKANTFTDFTACAEHLIGAGYAARGRIAAYGGSAGGMLMGAVANLRPDLWGAIIAAVPFVDVLNTMSDTTLPLTPPEWPEWGNPLEDAEAYDRIESYSPYDQVSAQAYPPVLATGGLSDPRVTYWEPAKWVARLREFSSGDAPILLKINMEAGHGGASGRFDFLKEIALDYAFAVWALEKGWGERMKIRAATEADAPALAAIYGDAVLNGFGTFEEVAPSPADMDGRRRAVQDQGLPYLVAEADGHVLGFAYAAPFRPRAAYRYTLEDSVYVAPQAKGKGVGRAVLSAVIEACEALGVRQLMAVIGDSSNSGSIELHRALGFEQTGVGRSVGFKHGRWVDIVHMQKPLNGGDAAPPDAPGITLSGH